MTKEASVKEASFLLSNEKGPPIQVSLFKKGYKLTKR